VPYPGHPFAQTHPDRLATLAILFGLDPAPLERCRVLELGCGDAANLVPMATALPGARFVGVDASPGAIARGQALVDALGLHNLELHATPIEDHQATSHGFDYVLAHGVYSWVAPTVRDRLLATCREALDAGGVAYVSYNALPGGRLRQALREMLLFHTRASDPPEERLLEARALLRFLLEGWPGEHEFGAALRRQARGALDRGDPSLLHDDLAEVNDAVYFHEFVAHAAAHGLQYLAEADFFEMQTGVASERVAEALMAIDDPLRREQYLDFLKGRMFRQTLLCRAEATVDRAPRREALERLAISTPARAGDPDVTGTMAFEGPTGSTLTTDHPLVIAALQAVARAWPAAVWVRDLVPEGAADADRAAILDAVLRSYAANLVVLHAHPPELTTTPGERPRASALARHQAQTGELVTNLRHAVVRIEDDLGRRLVTLLDGTRDHAALAAELRAELDPTLDDEALRTGLERSLSGLARLALLEVM
jgi:methyltransferase-like protein